MILRMFFFARHIDYLLFQHCSQIHPRSGAKGDHASVGELYSGICAE